VSLTEDEELMLITGIDVDYRFNETWEDEVNNRTLISAPGCSLEVELSN